MFCSKCGQPVRDGAAFCGSCGARVEEEVAGMVCSACGHTAEPGMAFCDQCGARLVRRPSGSAPMPPGQVGKDALMEKTRKQEAPQTQTARQAASGGVSRELVKMQVSWYKGETAIGIAKASGTLTVFTDRLELKKQLGSALTGLSPIALAASAAKAKKSDAEVFWMRDITDAKEAKYGLAFPSLVITMTSGEKHTFAGTFGAEKFRESVELIRRYCRH